LPPRLKARSLLLPPQAKEYLTGLEGAQPSRRDVIRALQKAAQLCPALDLGRVPGDLRGTKRLTADKEALDDIDLKILLQTVSKGYISGRRS